MTIYRGYFGALYTVNQYGVVCVKPEGGDWGVSLYSVKGLQDAVDKGYLTEVDDDQEAS